MSRRKHMMSWARRPSSACASQLGPVQPADDGRRRLTPRLVCAWGSKNISA